MNRVERNRIRKKRRRAFFLLLMGCIFVLIIGIMAVNRALLSTLGIAEEQNIFSFEAIGQSLKDMRIPANMIPILEKIFSFIKEIWMHLLSMQS